MLLPTIFPGIHVTDTLSVSCVSWHKGARREADEALVAKREAETKTAELAAQSVGLRERGTRSDIHARDMQGDLEQLKMELAAAKATIAEQDRELNPTLDEVLDSADAVRSTPSLPHRRPLNTPLTPRKRPLNTPMYTS